MTKIVLATQNQGKVKELKKLLEQTPVQLLSLTDFPHLPEVVEDGLTFRENAIKKAQQISQATGLIAIADDSGLEVDFLGGQPGVHSARYAGPQRSDADNNHKLLNQLANVPQHQRTARFCCVIAVADPGGVVETADGICSGIIAFAPQGTGGFGYDSLFYVPEYNCTFAELSLDIKNKISHRGKALAQAKQILKSML
ncbi:MAG: XTP/dITP diphosphatase [Carboxydocellales bacterium]